MVTRGRAHRVRARQASGGHTLGRDPGGHRRRRDRHPRPDRWGTPMKPLSADRYRLVQRLLDDKGIGKRAEAIPRRPDPGAPGPLSWAQQRLYFFDQVDPGSALYVVAGMLRMRGEVDVAVL